MLKLAEGIAMGFAMIASGGIAGGEIGGTYLLGQAARRADLLSGLSGFSFSTGRAVAATLPEQLSMAEVVSNPTVGRVVMNSMKDTRWLGIKCNTHTGRLMALKQLFTMLVSGSMKC